MSGPPATGGAVLLLTASVGLTGANSLALSPIAGRVAASFAGVAAPDVMTASAAFGAMTFLSALFLAPQADRVGPARMLWLSLALFAVAMAASALAPSLAALVWAQGAAGLAAGITLPAAYALAAALAAPGRVSATLGQVLTGWTLALVLGVGLAALVADLAHWRAVHGGLALLGAALLAAVLRRDWPVLPPRPPGLPLQALFLPGVARAVVMAVGFMLAFYGYYAFLGPHVTERLGLGATAAGLVPLAYGVGFGAASRLAPLIDRLGAARLTQPVFAAIALVYLAMAALAGSYAGLLLLAPLWGAAQHLGVNLIVTRMSALHPDRRGAILGLNSAVTYLAVFAGTLAYRPVFEHHGAAACALLSAAAVAVALAESRLPGAYRGSASSSVPAGSAEGANRSS